MHLPDHYLDPTISAATALLSGGAVMYALVRIRREGTTKVVPLAATSAVIFAAQMVNFPVAANVSGHVIGGAAAGLLLGPWAGLIAMAIVLTVQAVLFGDGGILALGANLLNMGVLAVWLGVAVDRLVGAASPVMAARPLAAALVGWLSVVLAALACALQMVASGAASAADIVPAMLGIHAIIGISEAAATALVAVVAIAVTRRAPGGLSRGEVCLDRAAGAPRLLRSLSAWAFATAVMIGALSPLASTLPDGLEHVAAVLNMPDHESTVAAPVATMNEP
ncbi:MAG: energy-coupling factor ABC transporter permease [Pirellulales bacterium]